MTDDGWILYEHSSPAQYRDGEKYPVEWRSDWGMTPSFVQIDRVGPNLQWRPTGIWKEFAGPKVETVTRKQLRDYEKWGGGLVGAPVMHHFSNRGTKETA